jgi:hypothetical protein
VSDLRGSLGAIAIGTALAIALAEVALRVLGISYPSLYSTDPCCGVVLRPGAAGWWTSEGRAYVAINSDGLRDVEHARVKDPQRFRIAVMGDSYAEAKQVAMEETFWSVTARELDHCDALPVPGVEVINFGVSGFSTAQELHLYESKARRYTPDLVLLAFYAGNDVSDNTRALDARPTRPYYELRDGELVLDDGFLESDQFTRRQTLAWKGAVALLSRSRLAQLVNELHVRRKQAARKAEEDGKAELGNAGDGLAANRAVYLDPPPREWQDAWRVTDALLGRFAEDAANDGADFFVAALSEDIQVNPDAAARRALADRLGVPDLAHPDRRLAKILTRRDIAHLGLAPLLLQEAERSGTCLHGFANAEPCSGHWNAAGHRAAGRLIAGALCQRLAARARDRGGVAELD